MRKYGHNIELAYNYQYVIVREMYDGDRVWDDKVVNYFNQLQEVYANAMGSPVYFATGKEYGILLEASAWATTYRDRKNA